VKNIGLSDVFISDNYSLQGGLLVPTAVGYDSFTKLMLHMNGANGATTFSDSSWQANAVTPSGNVLINTAESVFGGASCYFDGNGDYLSIPDSEDWSFGTGDFTVDFRLKFNTASPVNQMPLTHGNNASDYWSINVASSTLIAVYAAVGGVVKANYNFTFSNHTAWNHLELVRSGTEVKMFQNGNQMARSIVTAISTNAWTNASYPLHLGCSFYSGNADYFLHGWMDEFRISKGTARHTANFTIPGAEYS